MTCIFLERSHLIPTQDFWYQFYYYQVGWDISLAWARLGLAGRYLTLPVINIQAILKNSSYLPLIFMVGLTSYDCDKWSVERNYKIDLWPLLTLKDTITLVCQWINCATSATVTVQSDQTNYLKLCLISRCLLHALLGYHVNFTQEIIRISFSSQVWRYWCACRRMYTKKS